MPELPEVEHSRRELERMLSGKEISNVISDGDFDNKVFDQASVKDLDALKLALVSFVVKGVHRRGKQLWWELAKGSKGLEPTKHMLAHYGMTGNFVIKDHATMAYKNFKVDQTVWPPKFTKCEIVFNDETRVAFCDPRRLGSIKFRADPLKEPPLSKLAADPLVEMPDKDWFAKKLSSYSAPLKAVLLDQQKVVCGIGNWMADEIAFQSRVHPDIRCKNLDRSTCDLIHDKILYVVSTACSLLDEKKEYPEDWLFHKRWGKKKATYGDHPINFIEVGGRTTAFVPALQKLSSNPDGNEVEETSTKKKPNRKKKSNDENDEQEEVERVPSKVVRGKKTKVENSEEPKPSSRKAKKEQSDNEATIDKSDHIPATKSMRGRSKKALEQVADKEADNVPKKRGRPKKITTEEAAKPEEAEVSNSSGPSNANDEEFGSATTKRRRSSRLKK